MRKRERDTRTRALRVYWFLPSPLWKWDISCAQKMRIWIKVLFSKNTHIYFIFGHAGSSSLQGPFSSCGVWVSYCRAFSCFGAWAPGFTTCSSRALERRLRTCGALSQLLQDRWSLPRPGVEPMSPALAGGFITIQPPGSPGLNCFSISNRNRGFK